MLRNSDGTNENRAKFRRDSVNPMSPRSAFGPIAGGSAIDPANSVPGVEMGAGILGAPLNPDPHSHGRRSNNLSKMPPEKPGSHYAEENRRRIHGRGVDYK
jgi:hypothetical protein